MMMIPPGILDFGQFCKKLWLGTIWVNAVMLLVAVSFFPNLLFQLVEGMVIGAFHLWSLMFSVKAPKRKLQFVFSLTRLALLAYVIVSTANFNIQEISVVICGFLSYKLVLVAEYITQAFSGLRWQRQHQGIKQ